MSIAVDLGRKATKQTKTKNKGSMQTNKLFSIYFIDSMILVYIISENDWIPVYILIISKFLLPYQPQFLSDSQNQTKCIKYYL